MVEAAKQSGHAPQKAVIAPAEPWLVDAAKEHGLDLADHSHVIDGSAVRHVVNRHSNEKIEVSRGQLAVTDADFERIPDLICFAGCRRVSEQRRRGKRDQIGYIKRLEDGNTLYLEEVIQLILDFRGLTKLKSTYVDTLPLLVNPVTGRIHTSYNQAVAATGRLSSTNPNLQNIPIRTERGREIRKAFVPRNEEYTLLSADYSQIELRIIASMSNDEAMKEAFRQGLDIHTATAANIYKVPLDQVDRDMRRNAKSVNFGIVYGISAFGLSENLGIPRKEAAEIIDTYFATFPGN